MNRFQTLLKNVYHWHASRKQSAPRRLRITAVAHCRDGGTIVISGRDGWWPRDITLTQHLVPDSKHDGLDPGRLYLGRYQVPFRSKLERDVLALLRRCVTESRERPEPITMFKPVVKYGAKGSRTIWVPRTDVTEEDQRLVIEDRIRTLERIIAYVESDEYGRVEVA